MQKKYIHQICVKFCWAILLNKTHKKKNRIKQGFNYNWKFRLLNDNVLKKIKKRKITKHWKDPAVNENYKDLFSFMGDYMIGVADPQGCVGMICWDVCYKMERIHYCSEGCKSSGLCKNDLVRRVL